MTGFSCNADLGHAGGSAAEIRSIAVPTATPAGVAFRVAAVAALPNVLGAAQFRPETGPGRVLVALRQNFALPT